MGENIAVGLFPGLDLNPTGGLDDLAGVDGYLHGIPVSVKYDERIDESNNIYHELYRKSPGHPEQKWRFSVNAAKYEIFITKTRGIKVHVNELAIAERNTPLTQILATSMGFLIPIEKLNCCEVRYFYMEISDIKKSILLRGCCHDHARQ